MSTNKQLSLSFGGPRALPRHHNLPAAKSVCVCYLCVLPVCVTCVCYPLPNGGFELPVSPVCVTPHHKTVVAVNAPSARVTEGAPIKNTLSLPNSAQTSHQRACPPPLEAQPYLRAAPSTTCSRACGWRHPPCLQGRTLHIGSTSRGPRLGYCASLLPV